MDEGLLDALIRVIEEHETVDDPRVIQRCAGAREILAIHRQNVGENDYLCVLCDVLGQNEDCTYPCDTVRALARAFGVDQPEGEF